MVWEASNCSESVHLSTLKTGFSFIVSTPNYSCRLKVRSPPRPAAPVGRGFRPPPFLAGPLAPVVRVPDQPAVVEAREHAASVVVVVLRRVRPERVGGSVRNLWASTCVSVMDLVAAINASTWSRSDCSQRPPCRNAGVLSEWRLTSAQFNVGAKAWKTRFVAAGSAAANAPRASPDEQNKT